MISNYKELSLQFIIGKLNNLAVKDIKAITERFFAQQFSLDQFLNALLLFLIKKKVLNRYV